MPSGESPSKTATRPFGQCGRADLVAALADGGLELARALAQTTGFEWRPPTAPPDKTADAGRKPARRRPAKADALRWEVAANPLAPASFWIPLHYAYVGDSREPEHAPPAHAYEGWKRRPRTAPPVPPLASWRELEPRLRALLCLPQSGRGIDVELSIARISRGEILEDLPRQRRRRWGPALGIVADHSRRLTPFRVDQHWVQQALVRLLPSHLLSHAVYREESGPPQGLRWDTYSHNEPGSPVPGPGSIVLVLGDLGCLSSSREHLCEQWLRFGMELRAAGCLPVALLPGPLQRCPRRVRRIWRVMPWERPRPRDPEESLAVRAERLLRLVSPAVRLEPGLLRAARLLLDSDEADAGTEADVWQHPDLMSRSSAGATLNPERAAQLRAAFDSSVAPQLQARFASLLRTWRGYLPEEIWFEELLNLPAAARAASDVARDLHDAREYFAEFAQSCTGGPMGTSGSDLAWFKRVAQRAVPQLWLDEQVGRDLRQLDFNLRGEDPGYRPPPGFDPALIRRPEQTLRRIGLHLRGDRLAVSVAEDGSTRTDSGSPLAQLSTQNALVQVEGEEVSFWACGRPPGWADDWGWDDYGAWVSFHVSGADGQRVTQRMRWIEPGSFVMGSPKWEPERYPDEGPQHNVTLDEGFWLFDTACDQALWQAVMGKNPSHFEGARRPVEKVSWNDAQQFIRTLNEQVAGLDLCLPSEAQWEYACRGGTVTPFSFGETITPEQVNYDGNFPYAGGQKGAARGETVTVGSLPPNAWGLYEMQGNVWEWVQDVWHDSYRGAPADGSAWEGNTELRAARVIRGGSWDNDARYCRCAYRDGLTPDSRNNSLGFRCARVQDREPSEQAGGAEPSNLARPGPRSGSGRAVPGSTRAAANGHDAGSGWQGRSSGSHGGAQTVLSDSDAGDMRNALLRMDSAPEASLPLPRAPAFHIVTDRDRLSVHRTTQPAWASAMGRDAFGLWAECVVEPRVGEPVVQRLRWIPPGRFMMGSPSGEPGRDQPEGPQHPVVIAQGYWLFDTPCTQALWEALLDENPSQFQSPQRPVEGVSWEDVQQRFLPAMNARLPGFALPSEAQWEYACRAGTQSALYSGPIEILGDANAPALDPIAWYGGNSNVGFDLTNGMERRWLSAMQYPDGPAGTHPVKGKQANAWGLYDMLGNVWEWVQDTWHDHYDGAPPDGAVWEDPTGGRADRVIRGGSWRHNARSCRCAYRDWSTPVSRSLSLGFRCARVQDL